MKSYKHHKAKSTVFIYILSSMIIIFSCFLMSSNLPFNMILIITSITIFSSLKMIINSNMTWLMLIVIMLFVGGLMILYIFIMSLNSNMKMKEKYPLIIILPMIMCIILFTKNSNMNSKNLGSLMFSISWWYLIVMMISILTCMMFMSKMIISPLKPSKMLK